MSGLFGDAGPSGSAESMAGAHPVEPKLEPRTGLLSMLQNLSESPIPGMLGRAGEGQSGGSTDSEISPFLKVLYNYYTPTFPESVYSDMRMKENVQAYADQGRQLSDREGSSMRDMLNQLSPYSYKYRPESGAANPHDPNKKYVGVMAQDLEKSPLGRTMVENTPQGKAIDVGKGLGAFLAATANLNQRVNQLEGKQLSDEELRRKK